MADVIKPGKHIDKITRQIMELINAYEGVELGETHDKAYYGDLGKEAYEHSQLTSGNPHRVSLEDLGIANLPSRVDSLMKAFGTLTPWTEHSAGDELTTHTGETIYFQTTSRVLEYH